MTLRARVDNLTDRSYWASAGGFPGAGYLVLGAPRTFCLRVASTSDARSHGSKPCSTLAPFAAGPGSTSGRSLVCTVFMLLLCITGLPLIFHHEIGHLLGTEVEAPELAAGTPQRPASTG